MFNKYFKFFVKLLWLTIRIWLFTLVIFVAIDWYTNSMGLQLLYSDVEDFTFLIVTLVSIPFTFLFFITLIIAKRVLINFPATIQFVFVLVIGNMIIGILGLILHEEAPGIYYSILIATNITFLLFIREISNPNFFSETSLSPETMA